MKKVLVILFFSWVWISVYSQKQIEYQSGMGTRDPQNSHIWILYQRVMAQHEGMILYADSAHFNREQNDFTAYRNIKIILSDTTTIYGDRLFYNGNTRIVEIWGKEVIFIDGQTRLTTDHLSYDRNTNVASYTNGGHTENQGSTLDSKKGFYFSSSKEFLVYQDVILSDSSSKIFTDTLIYNTHTHVALFRSPTYIYSDSTVIYSEWGWSNTQTQHSRSEKATSVKSKRQTLFCDTLDYYQKQKLSIARDHVIIQDSVNNVICTGNYARSYEREHFLYITDSATAIFVDKGDSLFMHSDTIFATTNHANDFETVKAFYKVKFFRHDIQGSCDSLFYSVPDSLITMFYDPIIWYGDNQFTSDTINIKFGSVGIDKIVLKENTLIISKVDGSKYNQIKGKNAIMYFSGQEPAYVDVLGNAQSIYYLTEDQPNEMQALLGVNVGIGSDMRIYFQNREPIRIVTYGNPDMQTYPIKDFPEDQKLLKGFKWYQGLRPTTMLDIY